MKTTKTNHLLGLVNAVLIVTALIQTLILILGFSQFHLALPDRLSKGFNDTLSKYQLSYRASHQYLTIDGTICFKNLEIFLDNHNESIAECKNAEFRFSIFHWLLFKNPLRAAIIEDASICIPALYTSSGKKQHSLTHINLSSRIGRNTIHIKQGSVILENLKIFLKGDIPKGFFETQSNNTTLKYAGTDISHSLFKVADYFEKTRTTLTAFEQPFIKIEFMEGPEQSLKIFSHLYGQAIHSADWGSVKQWDLSFWLDIASEVKLSDVAQLELHNWSLPHYDFNADYAIIEFQPTEELTIGKWDEHLLHACKSIDARLMKIQWHHCHYDYLKTNYNLFDDQTAKGNFVGYKKNDWVDVAFQYTPSNRSGSMQIDACWNPEEICALAMIRTELEPYKDQVIFQTSPHWHADINIGPNLTLDHAQFGFLCQNLQLFNVNLDYLEGSCSLTPEAVNISPLLIIDNQRDINVQFSTNLKTKNFHLLTNGQGYPLELSPWFPVWWKNIFSAFNLRSTPLYTDLEVNGNWDDADQIFVYGFIRGEDFAYKDFHSQYASGTLWAVNGYLDLSNFHVVAFPGSEGNYDIKWVYRPESQYPYYTHLKGQGNLPENVLTTLPKTDEIRAMINAPTPPWVSISASVYGDEFPEKSKNIIYIKAQSDAPVSIYDFPLDNISLEAISTSGYLSIKPLQFGFARGVGHGEISIDWADAQNNQQNIISLDIAINGMHRHILQHNIPYLNNVNFLQDEQATSNNNEWNAFLNHGGLIDASLNASGEKGNLFSFTGTAQAHMYDADIGRIRLFGILSKLLDPFLFNISSFSLNEATAQATINHEILHFNSITLDGPSAEVTMHGDFNMSSEQLNFVVELDPYKNITTPVISQVLKVTKPLSKAFRMNLRGTKDNPSWELKHNPIPFP